MCVKFLFIYMKIAVHYKSIYLFSDIFVKSTWTKHFMPEPPAKLKMTCFSGENTLNSSKFTVYKHSTYSILWFFLMYNMLRSFHLFYKQFNECMTFLYTLNYFTFL